MSLRARSRSRRRAEINIVPLIDVLTVLIFFFLISMQFRDLVTLEVTLPEIATAGKTERLRQITVGIGPEGTFYFNGETVDADGLSQRVQEAAAAQPDIPVLIQADEESYLRFLTFVMDVCRDAGLENIQLQSR